MTQCSRTAAAAEIQQFAHPLRSKEKTEDGSSSSGVLKKWTKFIQETTPELVLTRMPVFARLRSQELRVSDSFV
jgi:hypothetical protein